MRWCRCRHVPVGSSALAAAARMFRMLAAGFLPGFISVRTVSMVVEVAAATAAADALVDDRLFQRVVMLQPSPDAELVPRETRHARTHAHARPRQRQGTNAGCSGSETHKTDQCQHIEHAPPRATNERTDGRTERRERNKKQRGKHTAKHRNTKSNNARPRTPGSNLDDDDGDSMQRRRRASERMATTPTTPDAT